MISGRKYLAFDLGAESGRAIAGILDGGKMTLDVLHRFPNGPVRLLDTIYWDAPGIHRELRAGLQAYKAKYGAELAGLGTDSWGVDFGLLDRNGDLLGNPVHYRDARTDGMPEALFKIVPRKDLYARTGIQVMQLNTIYQLFALAKNDSPLLQVARSLLCMADLQNYFFTGEKAQEFSLATTTQMYDPVKNEWATDLLAQVGIPTGILPEIVAPGSVVGTLRESIAQEYGVKSCPVIAPACHDTAAAVAAVPGTGDDWLYLSSGTWSLLGAEIPEPIINDRSCALNFTNEGGVDGTYRFLKNITGLWIVQECKREWTREGVDMDYAEITRLAEEAPGLKTIINPADESFLTPGDMPRKIAAYCSKTGQAAPESKGAFVRAALESLALIYRKTLGEIESLTGKTYQTIHIVGGGSQNRLLNQFTADATGRTVKTGPVEATAFGNCLMQAIALGDVGSLAEAREIVRNSIEMETFTPAKNRSAWEDAYGRFAKLK
jgi:rhamnulokinase